MVGFFLSFSEDLQYVKYRARRLEQKGSISDTDLDKPRKRPRFDIDSDKEVEMDGKRRKTEKENIPKATPISLPCPPLPPLNISTISSTPPSKIGTTHRPPSYLQSPISTYAQQSHAVDIVGRLDMMEEKMDRIYRKLCTINVANNQQEEDIKELKLLLKRTPEFITAKEEIDVFPIKSVEEYEEVVQKLVEPAFRRLLVSISDC